MKSATPKRVFLVCGIMWPSHLKKQTNIAMCRAQPFWSRQKFSKTKNIGFLLTSQRCYLSISNAVTWSSFKFYPSQNLDKFPLWQLVRRSLARIYIVSKLNANRNLAYLVSTESSEKILQGFLLNEAQKLSQKARGPVKYMQSNSFPVSYQKHTFPAPFLNT